jgi:hypothetical protein
MAGKDAYPQATRLLVTCDAGGGNGWRNRAWKTGMAQLAQDTGLQITCCHFPPGTSKWNKIEHRLFSQITLGWRGRLLTSYDVIINTISAVTTGTGLAVTAVLDPSPYPKASPGTQISDEQMKDLEDRALTRHGFHGEWNYTFPPVPRPAPPPRPGPGPEPETPGRCSPHTLNHPALTGISPASVNALATSLQIPSRAHREQELYARRQRGRVRPGRDTPNRKLDLTDHLLATLIRRHLHPPVHVIAALLGADRTTVHHAISRTEQILTHTGQPPPASPPPATRPRTLDELREYAASHGIDITAAHNPHPTA